MFQVTVHFVKPKLASTERFKTEPLIERVCWKIGFIGEGRDFNSLVRTSADSATEVSQHLSGDSLPLHLFAHADIFDLP